MSRRNRKRLIDAALVAGVFVPWLLIFGLHVQEAALRSLAQPGFDVARSPAAGGPPWITSFRREWSGGSDALRIGDRLLAVGSRDLRGVGHIGFDAAAIHEAGERGRVAVEIERNGQRREVEITLVRARYSWMRSLANAVTALVALFILLRAPPSSSPRILFAAFMGLAITQAGFHGPSELQTWLSKGIFYIGGPLSLALVVRWALCFPGEAKPWPAWAAWLPWLLIPIAAGVRLNYFVGTLYPPVWTPRVVAGLDALSIALCVGIVTVNTIRSDGLGRRRAKWVLWGSWVGLAPAFAVSLVNSFVDKPWFEHDFSILFGIATLWPLSFLVAITRQHLFDINRLLSATATLTVLGAVFLTVVVTLIPGLAEQIHARTGLSDGGSQLALTFLLVVIAARGQHSLRPRFEAKLFPDRRAIEDGVQGLLAQFDSLESPGELIELTCTTFSSLLKPESCVMYQRQKDAFNPVFLFGRAPAPSIDSEGPIVAILARRKEALVSEGDKFLGPIERGLLAELDAAVVCPLRVAGELAGFLCLGPKRSGDEFTPSDIAWIQTACESLGRELKMRRAHAAIEEERELQERYRSYVPDAIASELEAGVLPEASEFDVSVLFVDVRGFTTWAESRTPEEVFSTVNRYTEAVTSVVREHGGSVVEFNGDGMMALFGAPLPLERKERAALIAAQEIPEAVSALGLDVGVGVATGPAFVGNIRGVDRHIWTALGSTTNLASRLQSLTREFKALLLVDGNTFERAGAIAQSLRAHGRVRVRGFQERVEIYGLGLAGSGDPSRQGGHGSSRSVQGAYAA